MTSHPTTRISALLLLAALAGSSTLTAQTPAAVRNALTQRFPALNGATLTQRVLEVSYAPGGASRPHSHPCPVVGYVISGALRFQVRGELEQVLHAGDTFYEPPNGVHAVSANASPTEPVRFLAIFTCDQDGPLSAPVADSAGSGQ